MLLILEMAADAGAVVISVPDLIIHSDTVTQGHMHEWPLELHSQSLSIQFPEYLPSLLL